MVPFGITVPGVVEDNVPEEFVTFMDYCRALKFEDKPDYNFLRRLFKDLFNRNGYEYDYVYDWCILDKPKRTSKPFSTRRNSEFQKKAVSPRDQDRQQTGNQGAPLEFIN